eukprot:TRINITY_DN536_c0_g1_i7.p1 TRINITY_DN536_c0_g1~~TRINITY_DN536_c0_g1_i7.p1  ORF type:complete len:393 (+),score=87.09 TRINITY_DN536_c0_g1_i7:383-1561(+)
MESVHAGSEDLEMFPNQGLNLHPTEYLFDRSHSLFDFASPLRAYNHCASPGGFLNPENFPHIPEPKDTPTRLIAAMGEQPKDLMAASAGIEIRQAPAVEIVVEKEKDRSGDLSGRKKISTQKFNPRKRQHPERSLPSQAKPRRKLGKARLEKNRISAREFRLKRKTYIGSLEEQVDMLQKRLFDYQNELNQYKAKEQEEMLEHLNKQEESTQDLSCSVAAKTGFNEQSLNSYIADCTLNEEKREKAVKALRRRTLQLMLPDFDKYLMWSAVSDKSIFRFPSAKAKVAANDDQWNDVWKVLKPSRKTKKCLGNLKEPLVGLSEELQGAVKDMLKTENQLLAVTKKISSAIQEKVLNEIKFKKVQNVLRWVDKIKDRVELSEESLYSLACSCGL